jgi:peptidoglycan-N-acetylglucosamine deacetylase
MRYRREMTRVQLTFDDGPGPSPPELLDLLAVAGVHATFFLLGANLEQRPSVAVRIARDGHELGNHTYSHRRPDAISPAELAGEIARTDALLAEIAVQAGVAVPDTFPVRLPYGPIGDDPRLRVLTGLGRAHVHWTVELADWLATDADDLARRMRAHVAEQHAAGLRAVIDLHDASRNGDTRAVTVEAVRRFLG